MQKYLMIALGGALGTVARVWVDSTITGRMGIRFPYGTLVVNVSACVLLGFFMAFLDQRVGINPAWRWLLPLGFIGAYSTFSTFEWEAFAGLQSGISLMPALYIVLSIILGLVGIGCGAWIARAIS